MIFVFSGENDMQAMAIFVAQLIREGVTFKVTKNGENFSIELTGGF